MHLLCSRLGALLTGSRLVLTQPGEVGAVIYTLWMRNSAQRNSQFTGGSHSWEVAGLWPAPKSSLILPVYAR